MARNEKRYRRCLLLVDTGQARCMTSNTPHPDSPLAKFFCEVVNEEEDVNMLAQDCMCHHCNKFCLRENKTNAPRTCRVGFGDETKFNRQDTPGMDLRDEAAIVKDGKGIKQFRMKRTKSKRVVQHSKSLLKSWRANCDIKLLLYFSNPNYPDIGEIEDVCKYVVAYTGIFSLVLPSCFRIWIWRCWRLILWLLQTKEICTALMER